MFNFGKHARLISFFMGAVGLYLLTRLYNILSLPIFTDEAIYTRWSQIASTDANWRFISLVDGKQPLFIWFSMIVVRFVSDPLLAGRLVSVGAGLATLFGLYFVGYSLFKSKRIGFIASFLYILFPFGLVYDRIGLYDSLVGALSIWSLYFTILLIKRKQLDVALILGMVMGMGTLNKTSGFFSVYLLPVSLLLFNFKSSQKIAKFLKWVLLAFVATAFTYIYYSVLRLSPFFHIVDAKNGIFVFPFSEWIQHPFLYFDSNMHGLVDWLVRYLTVPVVVLVLGSFIIHRKNYIAEKLFLFAWFFLPFLALGLFGKTLYPRFILFMTLPLLVLAAYSLHALLSGVKNQFYKIIILLLFTGIMIRTDYYILNNFSSAPIPKIDLEQYMTGWPAGGGVREAVEFFTEKSQKEKIYIGTQGTFGLMPYALEIYLKDNKNVVIEGIWPIKDTIPQNLLDNAKKMPTYVLFYQPCPQCVTLGGAPIAWPLKKVLDIEKRKDTHFTIYQVIP